MASSSSSSSSNTGSRPPEATFYRIHTAPVSALCYLSSLPASAAASAATPTHLLAGDQSGLVTVIQRSTRRAVHAHAPPASSTSAAPSIVSIELMPAHGAYCVQRRSPSVVEMFDLETHARTLSMQTRSASFCRFSVSGHLVACAYDDDAGNLALWDVRAPQTASAIIRSSAPDAATLSLNKAGMLMETRILESPSLGTTHVASIYEDGHLRVFDIASPSSSPFIDIVVQPNLNVATSFDLAFSAATPSDHSNNYLGLAGGATDQLASFAFDLANPSTAAEVNMFPGAATPGKGTGVGQVRIRPGDHRIAAVASWDSRVRIVHLKSRKHLAVLKDHEKSAQCLAFSQNGRLLASAGGIEIAEYQDLFIID